MVSDAICVSCTEPLDSRSRKNWPRMTGGRKASTAADQGVSKPGMASAAAPPRSSFDISAMSVATSGMAATAPSGTSTTPKFLPAAARAATASAISEMTSRSESLRRSMSSARMTTLGRVCSATSMVMWPVARPMSLTKYQYFFAELESVAMLPTSCANTLVAVSWPSVVSTNSFLMSPSMVTGAATTAVRSAPPACASANASARCAASLAVNVPPTSTSPSRPSAVAAASAACCSARERTRSTDRPSRCMPPWWRKGASAAASSAATCGGDASKPRTPPTKPSSVDPGARAASASASPHTSECAPGVCRPQKTTPTVSGRAAAAAAASAPASSATSGAPNVRGSQERSAAASLRSADAVASPAATRTRDASASDAGTAHEYDSRESCSDE